MPGRSSGEAVRRSVRVELDLVVLFTVGAAAIWSMFGTDLMSGTWWLLLPPAVATVTAGIVEAVSRRRRRDARWVWPWLAPVLGMASMLVLQQLAWSWQFGESAAPDAGMALGLVIFGFVVMVPVLAAMVTAVAWIGSRR